MIINHNMSAINANRQMATNQAATAKSTEKLSSGLRINRAGDDAAGLAISEKMRAQVSGLNQATRNAQDGISLIQTAEGALTETHSILQRMRELSVQSGNDTNTDADRVELQTEVEALAKEVTRIGDSTEFNTQKLLNGEKTGGVNTIKEGKVATIEGYKAATPGTATANSPTTLGTNVKGKTISADITIDGTKYSISLATWDGSTPGTATADDLVDLLKTADNSGNKLGDVADIKIGEDGTLSITSNKSEGINSTVKIELTGTNADEGKPLLGLTGASVEGKGEAEKPGTPVAGTAVAGQVEFKVGNDDLTIDGVKIAKESIVGKTDEEIQTAIQSTLDDQANVATTKGKYTVAVEDGKVTLTQATRQESATKPTITGAKDGAVSLQIGANARQSISIAIKDMRAEALIGDVKDEKGNSISMSVADIDISTKKGADLGIQALDNAISMVSAQRSGIGATQNRLEHTINNLGTSSENLTAAESRIRDVDMAEEMMEFTKNNVLSQASQAMLAQAKALPNQVLSLLQ